MTDIHAINEELAAVKALAQDVKKVLADGKIGWGDLTVLFDLMNQFGVLNQAIKDAGLVMGEIKGADGEAVAVIVAEVNDIISIFKA